MNRTHRLISCAARAAVTSVVVPKCVVSLPAASVRTATWISASKLTTATPIPNCTAHARGLHSSAPRFAESKRDHYEVLGVARDASKADIKKAYFALAKKYHPDVNKDKDAPTKFGEATTAYDVLGDDDKRKAYDQYGHAAEEAESGDPRAQQAHQEQVLREFLRQMGMDGFNFRGGFPGMGGMRREPRGPERGNDIVTGLSLPFSDAVSGTERTLNVNSYSSCSTCKGSGDKPGSKQTQCSTCRGSGVVLERQGFFQVQTDCSSCEGTGTRRTPCGGCSGSGLVRDRRSVQVTIPEGVDNGLTLRLMNQGDAGKYGGPRGHMFVKIQVEPDPRFTREGPDVHVNAPVVFTTAALGGYTTVPSLKGEVTLKVPAGTQPGDRAVMRGKGIKVLNRNQYGNQYVHFQVEIPKKMNAKAKELLTNLAREIGDEKPFSNESGGSSSNNNSGTSTSSSSSSTASGSSEKSSSATSTESTNASDASTSSSSSSDSSKTTTTNDSEPKKKGRRGGIFSKVKEAFNSATSS